MPPPVLVLALAATDKVLHGGTVYPDEFRLNWPPLKLPMLRCILSSLPFCLWSVYNLYFPITTIWFVVVFHYFGMFVLHRCR